MNKMVNIPPIPEIHKYQKLMEAINQKKLVIFIGAGVSKIVGCKGWDELSSELLELCFKENCINFKEKESLTKMHDNKKLITICRDILEKCGKKELYYKSLNNALKAEPQLLQKQNIYAELKNLGATFVTTNADKYIDQQFGEGLVKYKLEDFKSNEIDTEKVYHIHGSIKDKNSLIFTVDEYIKRYTEEQFIEFLQDIFNTRTVLFIGYGLSEFELFDYIIQKIKKNNGCEIKHFALIGFFTGEENLVDYEQSYFNSLNIGVIPFAKDEKGYIQLFDIIQSWSKQIKQTSTTLSSTFDEITEVVRNG